MVNVRKNIKILLLYFIVFGTYYPSIFSGFNLVDDIEVFGRLEDAEHFDLIGLFLSAGSQYYRPLTSITFFLDKLFWGLEPSFLHLENIILHAVNTMLVFLIAEKVFDSLHAEKYELPFFSALLFALHPVNAETVNWISGRYDLLATLFVLLATLFIQYGLEKRQNKYFIFSAVFLLVGCFAKESALFFFPAAIFLIFPSRERLPELSVQTISLRFQKWKGTMAFFAVFAFYFLLRGLARKSGDSGIGNVLGQITKGAAYNIVDTSRVMLKVFGFYVKKLFLPLPLNFAIVTVSDIYFGVGLFFLLIGFFFLVRKTIVTDYFLVSLSLISSGIAVVFARVAWTPVAERYLYLSSAFFSIAIIGIAFLILKRYHKESWIATGALAIIIGSAYVTVQRAIIWQDNLSLYEDTTSKSPEFKKLNNELAGALKEKGRLKEADLLLSASIRENPAHLNLYINQADLRLTQGRTDEARTIILGAYKNKDSANPEVLKMLARIDEAKFFNETEDRSKRAEIARELIDTYSFIYPKTQDPFCLYRVGQLLLLTGKKQRAGDFFQRAYDAAPNGAYFKAPAKILADKLKVSDK